jgi:hypothetical protein
MRHNSLLRPCPPIAAILACLAAIAFTPDTSASTITTHNPGVLLGNIESGYYLETFDSIPTGVTNPAGTKDNPYQLSGPSTATPPSLLVSYSTYATLPPPAAQNGLFVVENPNYPPDRALSTSWNSYSIAIDFSSPMGSGNVSAVGAYVFLTDSYGCTTPDGYVKATFTLSDSTTETLMAAPASACSSATDYLAGFIGLLLPSNTTEPQIFIESVILEVVRTAANSDPLYVTVNDLYVGQAHPSSGPPNPNPIPEPPSRLLFPLTLVLLLTRLKTARISTKLQLTAQH